jgi:hypothetical protein
MRDIRADLQERLEAVIRDREELQRRISESEQLEVAIKALLKRESENFAVPPPALVDRSLSSFAPTKDPMGSFAAKDPLGVVKPTHWGELKVG